MLAAGKVCWLCFWLVYCNAILRHWVHDLDSPKSIAVNTHSFHHCPCCCVCTLTFWVPGQVLGARDAHCGVGKTIWPAGIFIKCPVTHKTYIREPCMVSHESRMIITNDCTAVLLAKCNDTLQSNGDGQILQSNSGLLGINYCMTWPASLYVTIRKPSV